MTQSRLRRLELLYTDCPIYFLTACTEGRKLLLAQPSVHESFIHFAQDAVRRSVLVGRYVIMPDHLHLFAAFSPHSPTLSVWMRSLKGFLSQSLRDLGVAAPHWQKGFFDHVMRSEESYQEKWTYVQQNPVRAGLVGQAEGWPYQGEIHRLTVRLL